MTMRPWRWRLLAAAGAALALALAGVAAALMFTRPGPAVAERSPGPAATLAPVSSSLLAPTVRAPATTSGGPSAPVARTSATPSKPSAGSSASGAASPTRNSASAPAADRPSPSQPQRSPTAPPSPATSGASPSCGVSAFPTSYFAPDFTGPISHYFNGDQHISVLGGGSNPGRYLAVCYPVGSSTSGGGAQAAMQIAAGPAESYTLTYKIRFPVGFGWETAGKLPGLCGGGCDNGGGAGSWSCRLMWRAGGYGEALCNNVNELRGDFRFSADGRWHTGSESVALTPGSTAGRLTISIDGGAQVASGIVAGLLQAGDTEQVSGLMFSSFYGGGCVAPATTAVDFADFTVTS